MKRIDKVEVFLFVIIGCIPILAVIAIYSWICRVMLAVLSVLVIILLIMWRRRVIYALENSRKLLLDMDADRKTKDCLIRNLTTENAELRRKLSRKRPKPQTEGKSDE